MRYVFLLPLFLMMHCGKCDHPELIFKEKFSSIEDIMIKYSRSDSVEGKNGEFEDVVICFQNNPFDLNSDFKIFLLFDHEIVASFDFAELCNAQISRDMFGRHFFGGLIVCKIENGVVKSTSFFSKDRFRLIADAKQLNVCFFPFNDETYSLGVFPQNWAIKED